MINLRKIIMILFIMVCFVLIVECFNNHNDIETSATIEPNGVMIDNNMQPVKTKKQAITVAGKYVFEKYNRTFKKYKIDVRSKKNIWIVIYNHPDPSVNGGGGPVLRINKDDGKVIYCSRQE